jgi:hypothetical protein
LPVLGRHLPLPYMEMVFVCLSMCDLSLVTML